MKTDIIAETAVCVQKGNMEMFGLSGSEWLFYGGLAIMAAAVLLTILCIIVFAVTGRKLKMKLEKEYGKKRS